MRFDVDPLRGWICLRILLLHLFHSAVNSRLEVLFGPVVSAWLTSWRLGFESFFVMAGFFLAHSFRETSSNYLSVPKFAQRRFTRLAVPFWCAVLLAYLDLALPNLLLGHHNALPSARSVIAEAHDGFRGGGGI